MPALYVISIKCVAWLLDVELLVSDTTCAPAVPGTKTVPSGMPGTRTVAETDNRSGGKSGGFPPFHCGNSSTARGDWNRGSGQRGTGKKSRSRKRGSGQGGTKKQRRSERSWKIMYYWRNPYMLKHCSMFKLNVLLLFSANNNHNM